MYHCFATSSSTSFHLFLHSCSIFSSFHAFVCASNDGAFTKSDHSLARLFNNSFSENWEASGGPFDSQACEARHYEFTRKQIVKGLFFPEMDFKARIFSPGYRVGLDHRPLTSTISATCLQHQVGGLAISNQSTNQAQLCLIWQFRRVFVLTVWYGRTLELLFARKRL